MSRKIPRALEPAGIVLLDKPAGISSFAAIAELRRTTGARTGHAGTLDPFATGLLVVLSGSATRLAQSFVKLDKRYVTEIDLTATTSTGDPEGEVVETHDAPTPEELEERLEALRGEIELPIPAASAVKIDGERAYRLHRRGVAVEMPLRRSRVDALDVVGTTGRDGHARPARQLRNLRPRDRRSARRSLPDSAPNRGRPVLRRGGRPARDPERRGAGEARVKVATTPGGARRRPARGRDRHVRRRPPRTSPRARDGARGGIDVDRRHVRPASAHGAREPRRAADDPRAATRAARRGRDRRGARARRSTSTSRGRLPRSSPSATCGGSARRSSLRERASGSDIAGRATSRCSSRSASTCARCPSSKASRRVRSARS